MKKMTKPSSIYLNEVEGEACKVRILKYSRCSVTGKEICTYELEYPRIIHAELLTHRLFSKNSSSTRAIPLDKVIDNIRDNPATYLWTENQKGMQGTRVDESNCIAADWFKETLFACVATTIQNHPLLFTPHKQHIGRFLEAFQNIKVVLTTTEHANWEWLRIDTAAQPEIEDLARTMRKARNEVTPAVLCSGEWHMPYVHTVHTETGFTYYHPETLEEVSLEQALNISRAGCAQVSYRNLNLAKEAVDRVTARLFGDKKIHSSPAEHQATPIPYSFDGTYTEPCNWPDGVTHMDRKDQLWSGNFCGWIQGRHLIEGNTKY